MGSLKWPLLFVCLCFKVIQIETSSWTIEVPRSVRGIPGSCVEIPCSFNYPQPDKTVTKLTGMWYQATNLICHPDQSTVMQEYRNRSTLMGDVKQKSCSLKIDPLRQSDIGPFYFRIEIEGYDKFSYKENTVTISMISELKPITMSVTEEVVEGHMVSASCSVSHSCHASPPVITWDHLGVNRLQTEQFHDGLWNATSHLNFHATAADHNKHLQCTVTYKGGKHHSTFRVLKVKHAPVNVTVKYKSDVKEGDAVQLKCSSDAHPPATAYEWHNKTGLRLHQGSTYMLPNVSRHYTGDVYCTANNIVGQGKSSAVQLNVLYGPEIKVTSFCAAEAHVIKCVCTAESKPPSMVHFVLSDRVLQNTPKIEKHDTLTIGTLQAELGSSEFVLCLANNTQGNASLTLYLPVNSEMQRLYIIIAAGAGVILLILLVAVGVVKKWKGRSERAATSHMMTDKKEEAGQDAKLPHYATTKRKQSYNDVICLDAYATDRVYGNMDDDCDDAIYANV